MNKHDWQVQLCICENRSDGQFGTVTRELPTFILPASLGLIGIDSVKATIESMFPTDGEIHGTIMDWDSECFSVDFPEPEEEYEPYEMSDMEADCDTLAGAGFGTDEDYGCYE